jgi:3-hydroxyacyl-CoA dehydrogenase/enoyl-CoA hydratase/3-hydroxybutyryl-CoA epimerase
MQSSGIQKTLIDSKRLGKKVKQGFYDYRTADHSAIDPTIYSALGIRSTIEMTKEDIVERCLYRMLNEAALCLEENIISCPRDGDIGAIFGIGFPPFLGGPFRYMDSLGINNIAHTLQQLEKPYGSKYLTAELLLNMKKNKQRFY